MAKMLVLRWTPITTNNGIWFDSNLVILNGTSGVHIEMKGNGNDVTAFQSMTGNKFVTCFQDYFGDIWDKIIPHPGIGQVIKFRVNRLPDYACIRGDIEDGGDVDPEIQMYHKMLSVVQKKNLSEISTLNSYWVVNVQ